MKFRSEIIRYIPVCIAGFVVVWCGFYLLCGDSNIFTLRTLKVQQAQLQEHFDQLQNQRTALEDKVVRMRPNSLDWDLVEQQAQVKLGPSPKATKSLNM